MTSPLQLYRSHEQDKWQALYGREDAITITSRNRHHLFEDKSLVILHHPSCQVCRADSQQWKPILLQSRRRHLRDFDSTLLR